VLLAVAIGILYFNGAISGILTLVLGAVAVVFLATGFMGWCPAYIPFGFSTRERTTGSKSTA
jgi:hypothetical protein